MELIVFHSTHCALTRKVIELIADEGHEAVAFDVLRTPPKPDELRAVLNRLKLGPRALMRTKEPVYRQLGLNDPSLSEGQLIMAMAAHPQLIDGPIVVSEDEAVLARPAEKVYNIL